MHLWGDHCILVVISKYDSLIILGIKKKKSKKQLFNNIETWHKILISANNS